MIGTFKILGECFAVNAIEKGMAYLDGKNLPRGFHA
jgi:hypothetical protein